MEKIGFGKSAFLNDSRKLVLSVLLVSMAVFLVTGAFADDPIDVDNNDPTAGFDIHVTVGQHDHSDLDAQYDHYCKLTPPIVATCVLFATNPSGDTILSEVEYIITRDQYLQLPFRDRPNWHNHATELTPERGMPQCVSLPDGLECGPLVEILQTTYGKVVNLWDVSDPLPSYPPYHFLVDSPYALKQDLNHNLHNEWEVGDESTSSVGILNEIPDVDPDPTCELPADLELDYRSVDTGEVLSLLGITEFNHQEIDYFRGDLESDGHEADGRGRFRIDGTTADDDDFRLYVSRFDANEILEGDCNSVTWISEGKGDVRGLPGGTQRIEFEIVTTYNFNTGFMHAIAFEDDEVVFEFEGMEDINF